MKNDHVARARSISDAKPHVIFGAMLPLYCPTKEMELWNSHPRVYLDITATGMACCPYCGTKFVLQDERKISKI